MRINNNVAAFNAYRNLSNTSVNQSKSLEKLSSGFRINRAADDAAGLTRSENLRAQIGGTQVAVRNAQDGVSFVQTAEGALEEVHGILQRMRDLAVSASNGTSSGAAEHDEYTELATELTEIGARTKFGSDFVFGTGTNRTDFAAADVTKTFQVGANEGDTLQVDVSALSSTGVAGVDLSSLDLTTGASAAITTIDSAIGAVSTERSTLGAFQNRLESTIRNLSVTAENLTAAESRIRDTDMAQEMTDFSKQQILQQAGTAMLAQANQLPQSVLSLLR